MPPIIQQAITGLSNCFLIFSIGTFHTNSFLRHPVDCAEVICFWTLQYFHYIIVDATWWQWSTPAAAAMDVCGGCATPPLLGGGGALATPPPSAAPPPAQPHPCRRGCRRRRYFATCVRWGPGWPGQTDSQWFRRVVC